MLATPLLSRGPRSGQICYVTPALLEVPRRGDKIKSGYITLAFTEARKGVALLRNPCVLWSPQKRGQNQKWAHHPCLLGGPQVGGIAT